MRLPQLFRSTAGGYLGCSHFSAIIKEATMDILFLASFSHFCQVYTIGVELLGHRECVCSALVNTASFPKWFCQFKLLLAEHEDSSFSTSLSKFGIVRSFLAAILIGVYLLVCISLMTKKAEYPFICLLIIWISSFLMCLVKSYVYVCVLLDFSLLVCRSSLYLKSFIRYVFLQISSPILRLAFS